MYKVVEISGIIGSYYVEGYDKSQFCYKELKHVINKIHEEDEFISIRITGKSIKRVLDLSNMKEFENANGFFIPSDMEVRNGFQRDFYKMDGKTRNLVSRIIKEIGNE